MKRFITRSLLFLPIFLFCTSIKPLLKLKDKSYEKEPKHAWVYNAIRKSKAKDTGAKIVILGDSVGNQLFTLDKKENSGEIYSLTCTAAIDLVGEYILLDEFLENNKPDVIYLIFSGHRGNLNARQVFHHFLKPFYKEEYKEHFSDMAWDRIRKIPYYYLSQVPHFLTSTWGPKIPFVPDTTYEIFSPLHIEYLKKIETLAKEKGIEVIALPPPIIMPRRKKINQFMRKEIAEHNLDYLFSCLLYTSPSPRDATLSRMPSSA